MGYTGPVSVKDLINVPVAHLNLGTYNARVMGRQGTQIPKTCNVVDKISVGKVPSTSLSSSPATTPEDILEGRLMPVLFTALTLKW